MKHISIGSFLIILFSINLFFIINIPLIIINLLGIVASILVIIFPFFFAENND